MEGDDFFPMQHRKMISCPRGKTKSKLSGRCIKKCKSGQKRNASNQCVSRKSAQKRKTTTHKTTKRKTTKRKTTRRKTTRRRVSRKVAGSRKMANFINHMEGRKVVKVSRKGNLRPSAGQAYRDGARLGSRACYDGKCKYLRLDKNGRAYWGV